MTTLRETAALFVEAGRALGMADECYQTEQWLRDVIAEPERAPGFEIKPAAARLVELLEVVSARHRAAERLAASAQRHAESLMFDVEHPGARLARRVLGAARAARDAWRESGP